MRDVATLLCVMLLLACSTGAQQANSAQAPQDVAARVGDRAITVKELDDHWTRTDAAEHAQAVQAIYDGRRTALDDLIADMLIEQAAKAKGQSPTQFTDAEIARRVTPVSDRDIAVFYGENRSQMQGRSLEDMSEVIRRYLNDRQRNGARAALIDELRKAGPSVRMYFDAPRQEVAVAADDPAQGPTNAPVTLVEFSDFQCPFCLRVAPTLKQIKSKYGERVRIVWKDFPLTEIHPQAFRAAEAGNCAQEQGKFWEYHDVLFSNQQALQPELLKKYAADAGLDEAKFNACFDSEKYAPRVRQSVASGSRLGINSTPTSFVNGRIVSGAQPYDMFERVIDEELARAGTK